MKKQEMEDAHQRYHTKMRLARSQERCGLIHDAVQFAFSAWDDIDGMMRYARKYEEAEFESVDAIELVLKYTPMLFEFAILEQLEELLKSRRAVERNTSVNLAERRAEVWQHLWDNHRLWNLLESQHDLMQSDLRKLLGGEQAYWRSTCETWEEMGLIERSPESGSYRINLSTRMGQVIGGKCPACGTVVQAPKSMLLEEMTCPDCQQSTCFVLIPSATDKQERNG